MPLANKTGMTEPERELIGRWIAQGAPIEGSVQARPPRAPVPAPTEAPGPPKSPERLARDYFQKKCVVCHGTSGAGDGPAAGALQTKPRKFGDSTWQASNSDEPLKKVSSG